MSGEYKEKPLSSYWERLAIFAIGVILAIGSWMWTSNNARIDDLEVRVQQLQLDKVSRQEFNALEDRIYKRMDGMKTDIIDRLDWYFAGRKSRESPH